MLSKAFWKCKHMLSSELPTEGIAGHASFLRGECTCLSALLDAVVKEYDREPGSQKCYVHAPSKKDLIPFAQVLSALFPSFKIKSYRLP